MAGKLAFLFSSLAVASCSSSPPPTFDLAASPAIYEKNAPNHRLNETLVIMEPVALQPLDGVSIVVRGGAGELTMLSNVQWSDSLPRLVQSQLLRAFENNGYLGKVARPNDGIVTKWQVNSELRQFNISATTDEAVVEVAIRIVDTLSGNVARARVFTSKVPVQGVIAGPAAAAALDIALARVLEEIVAWT